jgi:hypothetical protein
MVSVRQSVVLILICLWLAGCAQEYEGRTSYSKSNCREVIDLDGGKYPFFPILLKHSLFPVFICMTMEIEESKKWKMCIYTQISNNDECLRLYHYERTITRK